MFYSDKNVDIIGDFMFELKVLTVKCPAVPLVFSIANDVFDMTFSMFNCLLLLLSLESLLNN